MNAVLSATTLPWRESAAFDPTLVVGDIDPADVYEFIGQTTFDPAFRDRVVADTEDALARFRLPAAGQIRAPGLLAERFALADDERAALDDLSMRVNGTDIEGARAMERGALREGHGLPAVAALVVVVAVAVAVFVVLYYRPEPR